VWRSSLPIVSRPSSWEADAGTYIKELMHGDQGRTEPNVAGIVGVPCQVLELDVIRIDDKGA
jgi:tRNA pseudouridine synthase 10